MLVDWLAGCWLVYVVVVGMRLCGCKFALYVWLCVWLNVGLNVIACGVLGVASSLMVCVVDAVFVCACCCASRCLVVVLIG